MNDGSEQAELNESNVFELQKLRAALNLAKGLNTDAYNQTTDAFSLLKECRDLLELVMDHQLQKDILDLIQKIDSFYPMSHAGTFKGE